MVHDGRHKLIWYPCGNVLQLFDLERDPKEQEDLIDMPEYQDTRLKLQDFLKTQLNGQDLAWMVNGQLVGFEAKTVSFKADRNMSGQRGLHFPTPPLDPSGNQVGSP